eukprot:328201-Prymnesium_polylepis.1
MVCAMVAAASGCRVEIVVARGQCVICLASELPASARLHPLRHYFDRRSICCLLTSRVRVPAHNSRHAAP